MDLVNLAQALPKGFRRLDLYNATCCGFQGADHNAIQWCPWLQELGMGHSREYYRRGISVLEIIKAMDQSWECWNRLEALRVDVINRGNTEDDETIRHTYRLFLKL